MFLPPVDRKDVDSWLGWFSRSTSVPVNYSHNWHWHSVGVWRPSPCNEAVFTPDYNTGLLEPAGTQPDSRHLYVWLVITIDQTRQLIKHQNRHFLLADGWIWLPVCPGTITREFPAFCLHLPQYRLVGAGDWQVTTQDRPGRKQGKIV